MPTATPTIPFKTSHSLIAHTCKLHGSSDRASSYSSFPKCFFFELKRFVGHSLIPVALTIDMIAMSLFLSLFLGWVLIGLCGVNCFSILAFTVWSLKRIASCNFWTLYSFSPTCKLTSYFLSLSLSHSVLSNATKSSQCILLTFYIQLFPLKLQID